MTILQYLARICCHPFTTSSGPTLGGNGELETCAWCFAIRERRFGHGYDGEWGPWMPRKDDRS